MKKVLSLIAILLILIVATVTTVYAATEILDENNEVLESENASDFYKIKEDASGRIEQYTEKYGSKAYGITAMVLDTVRIYSIPFCFLGIAIGAIHQYIIGIRKLDTLEKGMGLVVTFVTLLVICQVLPLAFAVFVKFGRG